MFVRRKLNHLDAKAEYWRPPKLVPASTPWQRWVAALRCFLDLQYGSILKDLRTELSVVRGRLLDVGCGAQPYRSLLPGGVQYVGIDTAEAKHRFGYEAPDTLCFPGETWPIQDESVDTILCTETLEHVLSPEALLHEAARCLRPGGRFILTVPFAARWHFVPYDYWRFTPSSLEWLLKRAGFTSISVYARGNPLTVACYKCMALLLPLLSPHTDRRLVAVSVRTVGLLVLPILLTLALLANVSLLMDWGDDCLGYTVIAERGDSTHNPQALRTCTDAVLPGVHPTMVRPQEGAP